MIESMRHRGSTAELSPGLYLDKHCSEATMSPNNSPKSDVQPGLYCSPVTSTKSSRISPVLSRIHPSKVTSCFSQSNRIQRHDFKSKYSGQLTSLNSSQEIGKSGRYINHRKIRKKSKRETRFQMNGNMDQNFHSLKVTIRRTYKSNKLENGICAIVNNTPDGNIKQDVSHQSLHDNKNNSTRLCETQSYHEKLNQDVYNPELLSIFGNTRHFVDSSTSTIDSATLTETNLLGPCEPGTKVVVEGVVWLEATGMLVLSLHWRGRNYMGTLLDSSEQTFAPTCIDKGVASALNLLRGRKSWCDPHRGYQSRGLHHFHHMRHRRGGGGGGGVGNGTGGKSMTTRSASAAAAAASQDSREGSVDSKDQPIIMNDPYSTDCIDQPYTPIETNYNSKKSNNHHISNHIPQRGAKGRRRRGGAGRRSIPSIDALSPSNECLLNNNASSTMPETKQQHTHMDDVGDNQSTNLSDNSSSNSDCKLPPLHCPFNGCEKRFMDILSMRFHFTMGHQHQHNNSQPIEELNDVKESFMIDAPIRGDKMMKWMKREDFDNDDADDDVDADDDPTGNNLEISVCDHSANSSPPPKLARAHGIKDRSSSNNNNETSLILANGDDVEDDDDNDGDDVVGDDDDVDNIDPPKLHRVVSIPDSFSHTNQFMNNDDDVNFDHFHQITTTATTTTMIDIADEPPAASPAYSDISDDGTVSSSTATTINMLPVLNLETITNPMEPLPPPPPPLPPTASSTVVLSNLSMNQTNPGTTTTTPTPTTTPTILPQVGAAGAYIDVSKRLNLSPLILSSCCRSPTTMLGSNNEPTKLFFPVMNIFSASTVKKPTNINHLFYPTPTTTSSMHNKPASENNELHHPPMINHQNPGVIYPLQKQSPSHLSGLNNLSTTSQLFSPTNSSSSIPLIPTINPNHQSRQLSSLPLITSEFLKTTGQQNARPSSTGSSSSSINPIGFCVSSPNSPILLSGPPGVSSDQGLLLSSSSPSSSHNNTNHSHHSQLHRHCPPSSALSKSYE
ncbi:unnamed protein product [Schistosoma turkestanicum]|nr:unnamed protein product [Schistosoma turkestanicum]